MLALAKVPSLYGLRLISVNVFGDFDPSELATIIFIVLFFLATFITAAQLYRYRKNGSNSIGLTFLFMGTPILELVGFAVRLASVLDPSNSGLYLAHMIILGLGPLYLTAINCLIFPALIVFVGGRYSVLRPSLFVALSYILLVSIIHLNSRGNPERDYR